MMYPDHPVYSSRQLYDRTMASMGTECTVRTLHKLTNPNSRVSNSCCPSTIESRLCLSAAHATVMASCETVLRVLVNLRTDADLWALAFDVHSHAVKETM